MIYTRKKNHFLLQTVTTKKTSTMFIGRTLCRPHNPYASVISYSRRCSELQNTQNTWSPHTHCPKLLLNKYPLSPKPRYLRWYKYSEVTIARKIYVCSQTGLNQTLLTACSTKQILERWQRKPNSSDTYVKQVQLHFAEIFQSSTTLCNLSEYSSEIT